MDIRYAATMIVILLILAVALFLFYTKPTSGTAPKQNATTANQATTQNQSRIAFASSQYANYAYLISSANLSQQARAALSGYALTRQQLQNGTVSINIQINGTTTNQTIVLKPGYKLYILETSFGDDGFGHDSSFGDDGFVVVDPNGYIVQ